MESNQWFFSLPFCQVVIQRIQTAVQWVLKNILMIPFFATLCVCLCVCVRLQTPPSFIGSGNIREDIFLFLGRWSHCPHLQGGHHPKCVTEEEVAQKGVNYGTEVKEPKGKRRDAPRADLEALVPAFGHKRIRLITGAFASLWNWQQAFCKNRMN